MKDQNRDIEAVIYKIIGKTELDNIIEHILYVKHSSKSFNAHNNHMN